MACYTLWAIKIVPLSFYRAAGMQWRYSHDQNVRPSRRPSVNRVNCDKMKAPSEKSSVITTMKSAVGFPVSLR